MAVLFYRSGVIVASLLILSCESPSVVVDQAEPVVREPSALFSVEMADALLGDWRDRHFETMDRMGLRDGQRVVDLGAGPGLYTLPLARRIAPSGVVYAVDIQQGMLDLLRSRAEDQEISNVVLVLGAENDPRLPKKNIDWIFLQDTYHEMTNPKAMLIKMKESLSPGGRVVLIELRLESAAPRLEETDGVIRRIERGRIERDSSLWRQPYDSVPGTGRRILRENRAHAMSIEQVLAEWTAAGFELEERSEHARWEHVFVFKKSDDQVLSTWKTMSPLATKDIDSGLDLKVFADTVYLSGQPGAENLVEIANLGVKTIISLLSDEEMSELDFDEPSAVRAEGMRFIQVPIGTLLPRDISSLDPVMDEILNAWNDEKILIHGYDGNRPGAIWALFRAVGHGLPIDEAMAEGGQVGLRERALKQDVRHVAIELRVIES
jgi:ubiquinone/menaquinone biosynthesis C-methylase UbiE/protein tyrosine phosphatase (PTP) superfamily phosphohydrolase (DUF442 family)